MILKMFIFGGSALRWAQRDEGGFRFPPYIPLDSHTPLETTRTVVLDLGLYEQL